MVRVSTPGLGQARELGRDLGEPGRARVARRLVEQRAAERRLLLGEDHPRAAAAGGERRGEAGRAAADHQHVAMRMAVLVAVGVGRRRRLAQARGAADRALVDAVPPGRRPHEGLVVEARRQQRARAGRRARRRRTRARASSSGCARRGRRRARPGSRGRWARCARPAPSWTSALGSSTPAATMPRGRWYLKLRPTRWMPAASSADASVSPAKPWWRAPSKVKPSGRPRSIRPPLGQAAAVGRVAGALIARPSPRAATSVSAGLLSAGRRRRGALDLRARLAHLVDREDLVADRVAGEIEPAPAAVDVAPALAMHALGVAAHEQVVGPLARRSARRLLAAARCAPRRRSGTRSPRAGRTRGRGSAACQASGSLISMPWTLTGYQSTSSICSSV